MSRPEFTGVIPAVVTPFTADESVDYGSLRTQLRGMAAGGCHGAMLFGFAGEFYKLTDDEREEIVRVAADTASEVDLPLYASVTDQATSVAVDRARRFGDLGVDGLMVLPPFVVDPGADDLYAHVERIGEAVSVPVMVQYAPDNTGVHVAPETFVELSADVPNVNRYKIECTPTGPYVTDLLEAAPEGVEVVVGNGGRRLIDALDRGATGVIPGGGVHEVYVDLLERYERGDRDGARELHAELLPYLNHIGEAGLESFIRYEKRVLAERGLVDGTASRAPAAEGGERADRLFEELVEPLLERCR